MDGRKKMMLGGSNGKSEKKGTKFVLIVLLVLLVKWLSIRGL